MSVNHILREMQEVFVHHSRALATSSGFCQRSSTISASAWVQGLVFGWLSNPNASLSSLARTFAVAGAPVSPQAVQQRFGEAGAKLLRGVLEALTHSALHQGARASVSSKEYAWLRAFPALWIRDSTLIPLPAVLQQEWPGNGGAMGPSAALKVSVQWEWHSGLLAPLHLTCATKHDQKAAAEQDAVAAQKGQEVRPGEMHVFDLGYFCLDRLAHLHAQDAYFCCRYKAGTHLQWLGDSPEGDEPWRKGSPEGDEVCDSLLQRLEALPQECAQVEWAVALGRKVQLPVRLLAVRVPPEVATQHREQMKAHKKRIRRNVSPERLALCGWNLYITNAPPSLLTREQVRVLYRVRWQIERLFRLWKETLLVDQWRSRNPHRILCEIFAKLIGALLTQKLTAFCLWFDPARSLVKCAHTIAAHALALLIHLKCNSGLATTLRALKKACLVAACIDSRRRRPATFQRIKHMQNSLA